MVDALQVLFVHLQQRDAERGHLALHLLQLVALLLHLDGVLPGGLGGIIPGVCQQGFGVFLGVGQHHGCLVLGLLDGVLADFLGAEDGLLNAVFLLPVGLDLLGQNAQLLLELGVLGFQLGHLVGQLLHLLVQLGLLLQGVIPLSQKLGEGFHHFVDKIVHVLRLVAREPCLTKTYLVDFLYSQHGQFPPY